MSGLPPRLVNAVAASGHDRRRAPSFVASSHVRRGDLRFAAGLQPRGDVPRLVLVLAVDSDREFAEVMLTHVYDDVACEIDAVVAREVSAAPYQLVVETDLRGVVWTMQLGSLVGQLDDDALEEIRRVTTEHDVEPDAIHCGSRLAGFVDQRWYFKKDEGKAFRALCADCNEALLDDEPWMVEPGVFSPDLLGTSGDPAAVLTDFMHWSRTRTLKLSLDGAAALAGSDAVAPGVWAEFDDLGLDVASVIQTLIEEKATGVASLDETERLKVVTAEYVATDVRADEFTAIHVLGKKEPVSA